MPTTSKTDTSTKSDSPEATREPTGKHAVIAKLLRRRNGATIDDLTAATGWQAHSVRGAISGALKRRYGLSVSSANEGKRGRVYRIKKADDK